MSFVQFNRLPAELRLQVWSLAAIAVGGRNIGIWVEEKNTDDAAAGFIVHPDAKTPALLQTCQESRIEASRSFEKILTNNAAKQYFWLHIERDIMDYGCSDMENILQKLGSHSSSLLNVRHLSIDAEEWIESGNDNATTELKAILVLPNVLSVDVIVYASIPQPHKMPGFVTFVRTFKQSGSI